MKGLRVGFEDANIGDRINAVKKSFDAGLNLWSFLDAASSEDRKDGLVAVLFNPIEQFVVEVEIV